MNFSKFMVHEFFGIHGPLIFEIQCPTIFCDFGLFNSLTQAGGGGAYYMIFHYQKHTVLNYYDGKQMGETLGGWQGAHQIHVDVAETA